MEFSRSESFPFPEDLPNLGIKPRSPALQVNSLPAEPQGKPKNTGVGRLSLLQGIFLAQELNLGLLHCRWILYQLSYQGSPLASQQHYSQQLKQPKGPSAGGWIQMREMHVSAQFSRSVVSDSLQPYGRWLPGSSVHRIFQARVTEWVVITFSRGSSRPRDRTQVSRIAGRCFIL